MLRVIEDEQVINDEYGPFLGELRQHTLGSLDTLDKLLYWGKNSFKGIFIQQQVFAVNAIVGSNIALLAKESLIEIIKYGSKIFTEPDVNNKSYSKVNRDIYVAALYNIFDAMKKLRIFERFGFDLPKGIIRERIGARVVSKYAEWVFVAKYADWLNTQNELVLSGYTPETELVNLLEYNIDKELE